MKLIKLQFIFAMVCRGLKDICIRIIAKSVPIHVENQSRKKLSGIYFLFVFVEMVPVEIIPEVDTCPIESRL